MARIRHIRPMVVGGRNEIYARENGEGVVSLPIEPDPRDLANIVQDVSTLRNDGWSTEEIQQGFRNDQTTTS